MRAEQQLCPPAVHRVLLRVHSPRSKSYMETILKNIPQRLQRHLMFFNTQGIWGSVIHGIVLAMEEQRAMGAPIGVDAITGIKAGLMGPFAGIGDTIDWATLLPLVYILFMPMAPTGNPLGAFFPWFIVGSVTYIEGHIYSYLRLQAGHACGAEPCCRAERSTRSSHAHPYLACS